LQGTQGNRINISTSSRFQTRDPNSRAAQGRTAVSIDMYLYSSPSFQGSVNTYNY